jgi:hypothetical protein
MVFDAEGAPVLEESHDGQDSGRSNDWTKALIGLQVLKDCGFGALAGAVEEILIK